MTKVLDLFCGIGGFSYGFKLAGFEVLGGIEVEPKFAQTFQKNFPESYVLVKDVKLVTEEELLNLFGEVKVVIGGPPCQAFSTAGKRALDDPRALLVKEFLRVVQILKPELFVFENVKGFRAFAAGKLLKELLESFYDLGYSCSFDVVNAVNFAVPQKRERFVLIGIRDKRCKVNFSNYASSKMWSFEEATSDLPPVVPGESRNCYLKPPQNEYQTFCRQKTQNLTLHFTRKHGQRTVELIKRIPEGKSAFDVYDLLPSYLRPTSGFPNTYKRLVRSKPSFTITRNFCVPSSQNCIHPVEHRALTFREALRLQSFTDDYDLEPLLSSFSKLAEGIGNAVPPLLGYVIANIAKELLGLTLENDPTVELLFKPNFSAAKVFFLFQEALKL